jgi:hypothetical protein
MSGLSMVFYCFERGVRGEMMAEMKATPEKKEGRFPWPQVIAILFVILAYLYASSHPHGFFATLLHVVVAP